LKWFLQVNIFRRPVASSRARLLQLGPVNGWCWQDLAGYVDDAQARLAKVKLPPGSWIEWGRQFQNLRAATERLAFIVPICFILISTALYMAVGNAMLTATVLTAVPLALAGGVFALVLHGIPFSISAVVGFIAVSGVAVLNGLVLMTALVVSLGSVPMAIATGTGAEVKDRWPLSSSAA
jgi:heavy metal efflux system protein